VQTLCTLLRAVNGGSKFASLCQTQCTSNWRPASGTRRGVASFILFATLRNM
jgi:hypothetical protein